MEFVFDRRPTLAIIGAVIENTCKREKRVSAICVNIDRSKTYCHNYAQCGYML